MLNKFKKCITSDCYQYEEKEKYITQRIIESEYELDFKFKVREEYATSLRFENFKQQTTYLLGKKRGAGKDNDWTIIDDNIYEFDIKYSKHRDNSNPNAQLDGGEKWLQHLLWLLYSSKKEEEENNQQGKMKYDIYRVVLDVKEKRGMSRSQNSLAECKLDTKHINGKHYTVTIWRGNPKEIIDFTKILRKINNNMAPHKKLDVMTQEIVNV